MKTPVLFCSQSDALLEKNLPSQIPLQHLTKPVPVVVHAGLAQGTCAFGPVQAVYQERVAFECVARLVVVTAEAALHIGGYAGDLHIRRKLQRGRLT